MGNIGSSQPYGSYSNEEAAARGAAERAQAAKQMREEVEINALSVFLACMDQNSGDDESSKSGKVRQIEKELKEGTLTPAMAASAMLALINDSATTVALGLPKIEGSLTQPKSQVLLHVEFFSLFLNESAKSTPISSKLLSQSVMLADQLAGDRVKPHEAAASLANLITQVNQALPSSQQYPEKINPNFFKSSSI